MSTILYFGNDWNAENRTSSHHIARRLAQRHEVYYIECPGTAGAAGIGQGLTASLSRRWRALPSAREVLPGL